MVYADLEGMMQIGRVGAQLSDAEKADAKARLAARVTEEFDVGGGVVWLEYEDAVGIACVPTPVRGRWWCVGWGRACQNMNIQQKLWWCSCSLGRPA